MKTPEKQQFLADMESVSLDSTDPGLRVYRSFLKFFQERSAISPDDFVVAANFSYGWMPRMLKLRGTDADWSRAADILSRSNEQRVEAEPLLFLSSLINKSLVGASKLLHFASPEKHAIWDSRVLYYLKRGEKSSARVGQIASYFRYLKICDEITAWPEFPEAAGRLEERLGQECTPIRAVELTMWANGTAQK